MTAQQAQQLAEVTTLLRFYSVIRWMVESKHKHK